MTEVAWPSVDEQFNQDNVPPGSALERLIREHQDFHLLRPEEATDRIGIPPWLRVYWRKQHPELDYRAENPTGGYPLILGNLHAWMVAHPDLQPEPAPAAAEPVPSKPFAAKVGADLRISGAQATPCSESDIRINPGDTNKIIAAANAIGGSRQAQFFSADGGATWGQTTLPLELSDTSHGDPSVGWTTDGTAWAITIGIQGATLQLRAYQSTDGGQTWAFDDTVSGAQTTADKPLMWVDNSPTSPFKDNIYVIWHSGLPAFVNHRVTGPTGVWHLPVQVSGAETTGEALGGDVTSNSSGDVFAMWPDTGSRSLWVAKSTDGGVSFGSPVAIATTFAAEQISVPSFAHKALIYLSAGAYRTAGVKDLVYAVWTDLTGSPGCSSSADAPGNNVSSACKTRIWFSRSTDGGVTWAPATKINDQASLNDQFSPRLAVDQVNGSVAVIYYDTVDDPGRLKTDVWLQTSFDDGVTWSAATKVTTGQTDEAAAGADINQYGDYNGLSGSAGTFFPTWTDRRNGALEEIWTAPIAVAPIPVVTGISPASGAVAGGDTVTITGTGFTGAIDVSIGPTSAAAMNVDADTQITATSPPGTGVGTVDVTVTTPGGTSATTAADQFTYAPPPEVTGISPDSGNAAGGDTVTITGIGFTDASAVSFGSAVATIQPGGSDAQLTVTTPAANVSGTVDVTVTTPGGTSAITQPADQFTYIAPPEVTGISPDSGNAAGGDTVTITGIGFTGASAVSFGSAVATIQPGGSDAQLTVTTPAANVSGTVDVTVTTPGGTSAITQPADQFTYVAPAPPEVTGISPASGNAAGGDTVTITGTGFTGAIDVSIGPTSAAAMNVDADTQITATSPPGTGTVDVTVTTPGGTSATTAADQFTYIAPPEVTGISPASGNAAGGDTVTITGTGFTGAIDVSIGPTSAPAMNVDADTQITATSPPGTGTVDVTVTTPGGTSATTPADQFTYIAPPEVTGISPASGNAAGGDTVTITGTGFTGAIDVSIGPTSAAAMNVDADTQITATSPPGTGTVDVTVTTPAGTSATTPADQFTYM